MTCPIRPFISAFCLPLVFLLAGCGAPPFRDTPLPALGQLRTMELRIFQEYRLGWEITESDKGVDLGPAPPGAVLHLGILDDGVEPVTIQVYADDRRTASFTTPGTGGWMDVSCDLGAPGVAGRRVRLWLDAPRSVWIAPALYAPPENEIPNVLVFLIDTLRQDHLHCYGYARETSPNIDALARDGVRFTGLMPPASWTRPSAASLLYGVHPNRHGALDRVDVRRDGLPSLAESLARAGYATQAFVTNPHLLPAWNMCTEFERLVDVNSMNWRESEDDAVAVSKAIETISRLGGRPWFIYVHTMAPHGPYLPPPPYDQKFATPETGDSRPVEILGVTYPGRQAVIDRYDGEIAYADAQFGRLIAALREIGAYDTTLIVLLSDHGEEFEEHGGWDHGKTLYEEQLRVPLVIKLPGGAHAGTSRDGLLEMVDIAPTLLDLLAVNPEPRFDGQSFRPLLETGAFDPHRMGAAALYLDSASLRAAKSLTTKLIEDLAGGRPALWFDLVRDPLEQSPLPAPPPGAAALDAFLERRAVEGASGWHVLVTDDPAHARHITVRVAAGGLGPHAVYYPPELVRETRGDNELTVEFRMDQKHEIFPDAETWHGMEQQDAARLMVQAPPGASLEVTVLAGEAPVPAERVRVGEQREQRPLAGEPLAPAECAAGPSGYDAAVLPREFAVYVWHVPPVDTVADEELPPEMRQALEGLGYLN
jgi:hypothetical protein